MRDKISLVLWGVLIARNEVLQILEEVKDDNWKRTCKCFAPLTSLSSCYPE